jgi:hypothetical protein
MWLVFEKIALLWTAIILAYGVIALALIVGRWTLIVGRWTLKQIGRQVFKHHGSLLHPAQDQPH